MSSARREPRVELLDNMRDLELRRIDTDAYAAGGRPRERIAVLDARLTARQEKRKRLKGRREPRPTWIDRWLDRRKGRWERRLESIEGQKELAKAQVTKLYAAERAALDVEQQDRGDR